MIMTQIVFICVLALAVMDENEEENSDRRMKLGQAAVIMILGLQYFGCVISLINILLYLRANKGKIKEKTPKLISIARSQ